jgi:hypothetical protein
MSNPTVSTPIVDKNGKLTTVHRKVDVESGSSSRVPTSISLSVDGSDNDKFNAGDIIRAMGKGNPVQEVESADGMSITLDKHNSRLLFPRGGNPDVTVTQGIFGLEITVSFGNVDVAHIIAAEQGESNPTEETLSEIRANIADRRDALEEAMSLNGFDITPDPAEDGKEYWSNTIAVEDSDSIKSWVDVAEEIESAGGAEALLEFLAEEPDTSLHDVLWDALELD